MARIGSTIRRRLAGAAADRMKDGGDKGGDRGLEGGEGVLGEFERGELGEKPKFVIR